MRINLHMQKSDHRRNIELNIVMKQPNTYISLDI